MEILALVLALAGWIMASVAIGFMVTGLFGHEEKALSPDCLLIAATFPAWPGLVVFVFGFFVLVYGSLAIVFSFHETTP